MLNPAAALSRLGTETAFEVLARAKALETQGRSIINLGIGQPDFTTAPNIVEAAIKALRDGHHGYTPSNGIAPLRQSVAAHLEQRAGVPLDPDRVLIVPGGKVTMFFAILICGEPGVEIIYPNPGFPIYESAIRFTGATPVPLPLEESNGFSFRAEALLERISPRTRLIILNSPANPTGGVSGRRELETVAAGLADRPDIALLSDEIYGRILYDGAEHVSLLSLPEIRDRVILLDGWSKTYAMTGWRIGYSYWPEGLYQAAERLAVNCHSCVNAAAQWAAIEALDGPQDMVDRMVQAFAERRRLVVDRLNAIDGVGCVAPGGAFYAFPNITGTGMAAKTLEVELLEQAGVATLAGTSFGRHGEGYLRLSYANSLENIAEALDRIERHLQARRTAA
mgnify:CR=1 FL=1